MNNTGEIPSVEQSFFVDKKGSLISVIIPGPVCLINKNIGNTTSYFTSKNHNGTAIHSLIIITLTIFSCYFNKRATNAALYFVE